MKVALIHDWLTGMRGGEKVLECLCEIFPTSDIFTLVHVPGSVSQTIESHKITTSVLQNFPSVEKRYRHYLPFMPWAIGTLDLSRYDLVVSSSHCVAKGVKVPQGVPHICYSHTPMRYVWDQFPDYFGPGRASWPVRAAMAILAPALRLWDVKTAGGVTHFIANSENVRRRIARFYERDAKVVYPPVETGLFTPSDNPPEDFYLIVSAFAPYKRVDIALEAFRRLKKKLVVVGSGQEEKQLRAMAGPMVEFRGWTTSEELKSYYSRCRALIFPGEEDFGIVPVEAMAAGRPVIAYGRGGAAETVLDGATGVLFEFQTPESLMEAVQGFETLSFDAQAIRRHALRFDRSQFYVRFRALMQEWGLAEFST